MGWVGFLAKSLGIGVGHVGEYFASWSCVLYLGRFFFFGRGLEFGRGVVSVSR